MANITEMLPTHWESVKRIYEEGIATGNATFQTEAPTWQEWDAAHLPICRYVIIENNDVLAWAALASISSRAVYAGVAEVSVYVASKARGQKLGSKLLEKLIAQSEHLGFWMLQSGIFPENKESIALHQKYGFRIVGYRERIGKMGNLWRDNLLMERRSKVIGLE